jgi:hypothetical protein
LDHPYDTKGRERRLETERICSDPLRLQGNCFHLFLENSYFSKNAQREVVKLRESAQADCKAKQQILRGIHNHTSLTFVCWGHILYGVDLFLPFAGSAFSPFGFLFCCGEILFFWSSAGCLLCLGLPFFFPCDSQSIFEKWVWPHFCDLPPLFLLCVRVFGCVCVSLFRFFWGGGD